MKVPGQEKTINEEDVRQMCCNYMCDYCNMECDKCSFCKVNWPRKECTKDDSKK